MKKLVFVHGMGHAGKDPIQLQASWVKALRQGLERAGRTLDPMPSIELPFYGDELGKMVNQIESGHGGDFTQRGEGGSTALEQEFARTQREIAEQLLAAAGVQDDEIKRERADISRESPELTKRDAQNLPIVLATARILGRIPGLDSLIIDNFMKEVSFYLTYDGVRARVDGIVAAAVGDDDVLVVGHSLGSVVSYNVLSARKGQAPGSTFVTVGSPLGLDGVRSRLATIASPEGISAWLNAFDSADIVALYPLDARDFDDPPVENYGGVKNFTSNHHGIKGYLADPTVAARIADTL